MTVVEATVVTATSVGSASPCDIDVAASGALVLVGKDSFLVDGPSGEVITGVVATSASSSTLPRPK